MISKLITKYLKTNRRVNIPSVGAFMVKGDEGREIIFSELLKSDDGVLNSLLKEQGLNDIESAATIDRFVFELRHATNEGEGEFEIENFGVLRRESGGRLSFTYTPHIDNSAQAEELSEPIATTPASEPVEIIEVEIQPTEAPSSPASKETKEPPREGDSTSKYTAERIKELYSRSQTFRESENVVKDLHYSQHKQKPLGGYTYVREDSSKRGVDKVMLFGVLAAVVALGAIAYGFYVANIEDVTEILIKLGLKSVE